MSAFLNDQPDRYGVITGATCMACQQPVTGRGNALTKAKLAHKCPTRPARTTP